MGIIHDPVGIFALILAAFLLASWLSEALRLNRAGLMLALGLIAGIPIMGIVEPGAALQVLGSIGAIYIFFLSGLSVSGVSRILGHGLFRLSDTRRALIRFMYWSFAPALIGVATGIALGFPLFNAFAIGILFASAGADASLGENVPKFQDGAPFELFPRYSVLIILSMLILSSVSSGVEITSIILTCGFSCVFAALELSLLPKLVLMILRRARRPENIRPSIFLFFVFLCAYAGTFIYVPSWFSAFFAGVALSPQRGISGSSETQARIPGGIIFSSAAFFLMGVSLDIRSLGANPRGFLIAAAILVVGLASRALAAVVSRRISSHTSQSIGFALPFTVFSLAVAWVLFENGLLSVALFSGAILLMFVNCAASNAFLKRASPAPGRTTPHEEMRATAAIPNRILVALSNPRSITQLLDLATALHGADNQSPIFPLVVREPSEPDGIAAAASETLLAKAVMRLSDMKKPVLPLSLVSENPARGILDAADGKQCDTIIIGWNDQPRLAHAFFGSIIDRVMEESTTLVLVSRTQFPWKTTKQLFAIVPPGVENQSGFDAAFLCVERLAQASYATLYCLSEKNSGFVAPPHGVEKSIHFTSWREIPELLGPLEGTAATIALFSTHSGDAHENPAYERLPHLLAERYPRANVLVLYAPRNADRAEPENVRTTVSSELAIAEAARKTDDHHTRAILFEAVKSGRVKVHAQGSAIVEAIYDLIFSALPQSERGELQNLADRCIDLLRTQPIEIEPGVVLLHESHDAVLYPIVCFSVNKSGFRLSALENPTQVIVLILVPPNQKPEDHLRFLADIASLFHSDNLKMRLLSANQPEDLVS